MRSTHRCFHAWAGALTAAILITAAPLRSYATDLGEAVHACAHEPDDAKRLACYDGAAGRVLSQAAPARAPVTAPGAAPGAAQARAPVATPAATQVTATIRQLSRRADGRYVITLSNGDAWLEAELKERFQAHEGESVTVRTEFLGARYLRTQHGSDVRVIPAT